MFSEAFGPVCVTAEPFLMFPGRDCLGALPFPRPILLTRPDPRFEHVWHQRLRFFFPLRRHRYKISVLPLLLAERAWGGIFVTFSSDNSMFFPALFYAGLP